MDTALFARRLITRTLAIVPALCVLAPVGDSGVTPLLIGSQLLLSLQLPFAVVPLIKLTNLRTLMGDHHNRAWTRALAWLCAALVVGANAALVSSTVVSLRTARPDLAWAVAGVSLAALLLFALLCAMPLAMASKRSRNICRRTIVYPVEDSRASS